MTRIAVIRALALGDMLCAVPTLRALRARFPDAHFTLIGLPWAAELVERFPAYLDELVEFPGFPGIPEVPVDPGRTTAFVAAMRERPFDLVVQLQGDGTVINEFAVLLGARQVAGFVPTDGGTPTPRETGDIWLPYPARGHEIDRLLALALALGGPVDGHLEFPVTGADRSEATRLLAESRTHPAPFVVVHAGGSRPDRRWPIERFAAVADALAEHGFDIVLTGTAREGDVTAGVRSGMRSPATDLAGRTSIGSLAALLEGARLVVTNDTGVSHLAAAIGADSVTIFTASDRERWMPRGARRHLAVGAGIPDGGVGRVNVPVDDVLDATERLLSDRRARDSASGRSRSHA
jgi:ADP-heptose:LPS heptosyltransferase